MRMLPSVSTDQCTTSLRLGSGNDRLLGECLPAPWPTPEGSVAVPSGLLSSTAQAPADKLPNQQQRCGLAHQCWCLMPQYLPIPRPLQASCSSAKQTLASFPDSRHWAALPWAVAMAR